MLSEDFMRFLSIVLLVVCVSCQSGDRIYEKKVNLQFRISKASDNSLLKIGCFDMLGETAVRSRELSIDELESIFKFHWKVNLNEVYIALWRDDKIIFEQTERKSFFRDYGKKDYQVRLVPNTLLKIELIPKENCLL